MLRFYNSLGRKVQDFAPITEGAVKMYTCGPTVWNFAHIGNFRTFVFEDLLRRYLKFKGFKVVQVMNITDVEDRIIRGIKESGKSLKELTSSYEGAFHEDLAALRVELVEFYPRATEHIPEMVKLIGVLMDKGFAYAAADGSIYFAVSKFSDYGALSGVKLDAQMPAGRVSSDHYEDKQEASDFALWKSWDPDDGEVFWETGLGKGRPGWHIECSAMSMKYLGESFDIHTGGMDNKFPHHENEIAQSEAATGKKFVNYWLHSGILTIRGEEMHKSVGNVINLRGLIKEGWGPLTIRLFLLSARYRDPIDLTTGSLEQARSQMQRLQELSARLESIDSEGEGGGEVSRELLRSFEEAMDDDLNTPGALAAVFAFVRKVNTLIDSGSMSRRGALEALAVLKTVNAVLGVLEEEKQELSGEEAELLARREESRKRKDFGESDRLREELFARGVVLEDTPTGTRWRRRSPGKV